MWAKNYPKSYKGFQLGWRMTFTFNDNRSKPLVIEYPLTVEFDITRFGTATNTGATFNIYNLNKATRDLIFKPLTDENEESKRVFVNFEAGYNNTYSLLYHGVLQECNSHRASGSPDVITTVTCFDRRPLAYTNKTYSANTPVEQIVKDIAEEMGYKDVYFGNFKTMTAIPYTTSSRAISEINTLTGGSALIDNGKLYVLQPHEVVGDVITKFDSTNIFDTPKREGVYLRFNTKLCPEIRYTQLIEVKSDVQPQYDGILKVMGIRHFGSISGGVPCTAQTELFAYYGTWVKYMPTNITTGATYTPENIATNTEQDAQINDKFVDYKTGMSPSDENSIALDLVYQDLLQNGKNAKSLNQRVGISNTTVRWGYKLIDVQNFDFGGSPDKTQLYNLYNTFNTLCQFIAQHLGTNALKGLVVSDGWRNKGFNKYLLEKALPTGGVKPAENTLHLDGKAIDFHIKGYDIQKVFNNYFAPYWGHGFKYCRADKNFIHVQIGSRKADPR